MMRRGLSLLLAALILLQNVALPHAHASVEGDIEHDQRPHVHLPFLSPGHVHSHHHHHGHSDETVNTTTTTGQEPATAQHHEDEDPDESLPDSPPAGEHDADAVYLSTAVFVKDLTSTTVSVRQLSITAEPAIYDAPFVRQVPPPRALPPPIIGCCACLLYLQMIALLI